MKNLFSVLLILGIFAGCNNKKEEKPAADLPEKKTEASITYPYKAEYSSDMSMGDPNHAKLVLDCMKLWEDNKVSDMRAFFADTIAIDFANGSKYRGTADSLIKLMERSRMNYTTTKVTVDAWMPAHLNDKNEDLVFVWERDYNTDKQGKIDSMGYHNVYQIKSNKITYCGEFQSKLKE